MKKLPQGALILLVLMSATLTAFADDWKTHVNKKLGYSVEYPDIYQKTQEASYDDGFWEFEAFNFDGGRDRFTISSVNNDGKATPKSEFKDLKKMIQDDGLPIIPDSEKIGDHFYSIDYYIDDSWIRHIYEVFTKKLVINVDIIYPSKDAKKFVEITNRVDKSLKLIGK